MLYLFGNHVFSVPVVLRSKAQSVDIDKLAEQAIITRIKH
jgi:hypothetical protein